MENDHCTVDLPKTKYTLQQYGRLCLTTNNSHGQISISFAKAKQLSNIAMFDKLLKKCSHTVIMNFRLHSSLCED